MFGKDKNVTIVAKAMGAHEGKSELFVSERSPFISTMSNDWVTKSRFARDCEWTRKEEVSVGTLDSLISCFGRPSFCKIDVEGSEAAVLKGLTTTIGVISFEFTKELFENTKEAIELLSSLGPVTFNCCLADSMDLLFSSWVTPGELCEKLDSIDEKDLWGDVYARFT